MFEHILVPLDGSTRAEAALPIAARIAHAAGSSVVLLQVVSMSISYGHGREHLLTRTSDLNLLVTWSVTSAQDVAETIVTTAEKGKEGTEENGCDVLAMATHGHGGIERWVMGSVTERVIGASTVPVLVVRPPQDALLM